MMYSVGQGPYNLLNKIHLIVLTSHVLSLPSGSLKKKKILIKTVDTFIIPPPICILYRLIPSFHCAKNDR